jgi:hypothetical protein
MRGVQVDTDHTWCAAKYEDFPIMGPLNGNGQPISRFGQPQ